MRPWGSLENRTWKTSSREGWHQNHAPEPDLGTHCCCWVLRPASPIQLGTLHTAAVLKLSTRTLSSVPPSFTSSHYHIWVGCIWFAEPNSKTFTLAQDSLTESQGGKEKQAWKPHSQEQRGNNKQCRGTVFMNPYPNLRPEADGQSPASRKPRKNGVCGV